MGMGHSVRHVLAALAFAGVLAFFCVLLVQAQVIQGEEYYETSLRSKAKVERVPAARGKILDRNGKVLVRDEVRWTAVVAEGAPEESRVRLAQLCREEGVRWDGEGVVTGVTARLLARGKEEGLEGVTFSPAVERVGSGALAKGWSQAELAKRINERAQVVQEYESGKAAPAQAVLAKMERALEVKLRGKGVGAPLAAASK